MAKAKPEHQAKPEKSPESPKTQSRAKTLKEYMSTEYGIALAVVVAVGAAVLFARTVSNIGTPSGDQAKVSTERPQTEEVAETKPEQQAVPPATSGVGTNTAADDQAMVSTERPQPEEVAETKPEQQAAPPATPGAVSMAGMPGTVSHQGRWVCSEWTYRPPLYGVPAVGGMPGRR